MKKEKKDKKAIKLLNQMYRTDKEKFFKIFFSVLEKCVKGEMLKLWKE